MKKRMIRSLVYAMGAAMLIGMCGCSADGKKPRGPIDTDTEDETPTPTEAGEVDGPSVIDKPVIENASIDYTSEKTLLDFLSGEWKQVDKISGVELGILNIGADGSIAYTQSGSKDTCKGRLKLTQDSEGHIMHPDMYRIEMDNIPDYYKKGQDISAMESGGYFHIARSKGSDLLYLEEVGNGGTILSYCLFNNADEEDFCSQWVFSRDNEITAEEELKQNTDIYAMVWSIDNDSMLLQEMKAVTYETGNDYTGFKYMGALFDEAEHPVASWYKEAAGLDLDMVWDEKKLNGDHPAKIYSVKIDADGNVCALSDVNEAFYGEYELFPLEQDISYSGMTFKCNDAEYKLEDLGNIGNNIENVTVNGDYAIIEAHLNPHRSIYTFFNMRTAWPERTLAAGALLMDDAVYDHFYSDMDCVYDSSDNLIHRVDGVEIAGLSFTDDGKHIKVEYWKDDMTTIYEDVIERPEAYNAPMFAYAEFRKNPNAATWQDFVRYAPDDSLFMVMVNPPEDSAWDYCMPQSVGDGGSDLVYVVALQDDTGVSFGVGDYDILNKGEIKAYSITVPEGGWEYTLSVETAYGSRAEWEVMIISGKDPVRCSFGTPVR